MKKSGSNSNKPPEGNLGGVIAACTALVTAIGGVVTVLKDPTDPTSKTQTPNPSVVRFKVANQLGNEFGQLSEKVTLLIDGRFMADFNVNMQYPTTVIELTLPSEGKYSYTANVIAVFTDGREYSCAGQGFINVSQDKVFQFAANMGGGVCHIVLVE